MLQVTLQVSKVLKLMLHSKTAGLSMVADSTGLDIEKEIQNSVSETANIRANAYIQFHPNINAGREKLKKQWHHYQLTNE